MANPLQNVVGFLRRITGFSTPFGGLTWARKESPKDPSEEKLTELRTRLISADHPWELERVHDEIVSLLVEFP